MRFIFGYVTCCMTSTPCNTDDSSSTHVKPTRAEEETRSLVTASPSKAGRRRKRAWTRGSSADWQPSLFVIAEDNAIAEKAEKMSEKLQQKAMDTIKKQTSQRNVKRCGVGSGRVNVNSRSCDFSRDPIPMVVPAFSAAPFTF